MKKAFILLMLLCVLATAVGIYAETRPTKGYVKPDIGLNVRKGPSSSSAKIGALGKGDTVTIDSVSGEWYKISSPMSGYVYSQHIAVTDSIEEEEDESKLSPEEIEKIGCDIDRSLSKVKIMKTPNSKNGK